MSKRLAFLVNRADHLYRLPCALDSCDDYVLWRWEHSSCPFCDKLIAEGQGEMAPRAWNSGLTQHIGYADHTHEVVHYWCVKPMLRAYYLHRLRS